MSGCKKPKRKPYGTKGTDPYCRPHDCHMVYTVSKKGERAKAKREIEKAPREPEYDEREWTPTIEELEDVRKPKGE